MLTRKPRKGDRLTYHDRWAGRQGHIGTVVRVEGNICHYRTTAGTHDLFIWRFHDTLNELFSLEGKQ